MAAPALPVPGAIPTVMQNAINGIATAAANAGDVNTVSLLLRCQHWLVQISTAYTGVAATTTPLAGWPTTVYPFNFGFSPAPGGFTSDANAIVAKQLGLSTGALLGA